MRTRVRELYAQGLSLRAVAAQVGLSHERVRELLGDRVRSTDARRDAGAARALAVPVHVTPRPLPLSERCEPWGTCRECGSPVYTYTANKPLLDVRPESRDDYWIACSGASCSHAYGEDYGQSCCDQDWVIDGGPPEAA